MQCNEAQALIDLQVDGSLTATRGERLQAHLRDCAACADELAELTRLREVLAAQRSDAPPPGLLQNLWPTLAIAAQAAVEKQVPIANAANPAATAVSLSAPSSNSSAAALAAPMIGSSQPARRTTSMSTTAVVTAANSRKIPAKTIHPRWRNSAVAGLLAVLVLVVAYAIGNQSPLGRYNPGAEVALSAPPSQGDLTANWNEQPNLPMAPPLTSEELDLERGDKIQFRPEEPKRAVGGRMREKLALELTTDELKNAEPLRADEIRRQLEANAGLQVAEVLAEAKFKTDDGRKKIAETQSAIERTSSTSALQPPSAPPMAALLDPVKDTTSPVSGKTQPGKSLDQKAAHEGWGVHPTETPSAAPDHANTTLPPADPAAPTLPTAPGRDLFAPPQILSGATGSSDDLKSTLEKPKVIKSGDLAIEVKSFTEGSQAAIDTAIRHDGWLASNQVVDLPGGAKRGDIVFRCLPEKFEGLYNDLKKIGKVQSEKAAAQDITAAFTDTEARIRNLQITEARLQEMIKSKNYFDRLDQLLVIEQQMEKVRGEIESMQGQLRVWANMISYSSIRLTLTEPTVATPAGSLSIEVGSLATAKEALDAALSFAGGKMIAGTSTKRGDGTLMGNYEVRVNLAQFSRFLTTVKSVGRVHDEQIQNQPFAGSAPEGAANVPCTMMLVLYEKAAQLPGGSVRIEVESLGEALKKLDGILTGLQVTVANNQTSRAAAASGSAQLQLTVRAGQFATLVEALKAVGKIAQQNVSGEVGAITGGTADMPATLQLTVYEAGKGAAAPAGTLGLEVAEFDVAQEALKGIVETFKIEVEEASSRQVGKQTVAAYTLAIRADKIDAAVRALEKLGTMKVRQLQGIGLNELAHADADTIGRVVLSFEEKPETVKPMPSGVLGIAVEKYSETQESLKAIVRDFHIDVEEANSSRVNRQTVAVFKLAVPAAKVDAVVAALEKLGEVNRRELQGVGLGDLAKYDNDAKGTLTVTLQEKPPATVTPSSFEQTWEDALGGFGRSLSAILRGFGVILPWLALLLAALFLGRRWWRKSSPSIEGKPTATEAHTTAAGDATQVDSVSNPPPKT